jgi:chromate transport protein ChrA
MSTTEERSTGNVPVRTLITVLAVADLAACAMIGRAVQRVVTEPSIAWENPWVAGALLAVAALALAAAVWLAIRAWGSGSPRRWWLLAAYSTASITLCAAAVWLVLLLEDLSY